MIDPEKFKDQIEKIYGLSEEALSEERDWYEALAEIRDISDDLIQIMED